MVEAGGLATAYLRAFAAQGAINSASRGLVTTRSTAWPGLTLLVEGSRAYPLRGRTYLFDNSIKAALNRLFVRVLTRASFSEADSDHDFVVLPAGLLDARTAFEAGFELLTNFPVTVVFFKERLIMLTSPLVHLTQTSVIWQHFGSA